VEEGEVGSSDVVTGPALAVTVVTPGAVTVTVAVSFDNTGSEVVV